MEDGATELGGAPNAIREPAELLAERYRQLLDAAVVLSDLSIDRVLQRIVDLAAELTGARYAALGVLSPEGRRIVAFLTHGVSADERAAIGTPPTGRGLLGVLIDDPRPLRLTDLELDPRAAGMPAHHPRMRSFLGAPVRGRGRVLGNLYLTEKEGGQFSAADEELLGLLAAQAGTAIENARLYGQSERRALRLEAFRQIASGLLGGMSLGEVLGIVANRARELAEAAAAAVLLPDGEPGALRVVVADGPFAEAVRETALLAGNPLWSELDRGTTPVRLDAGTAELRPAGETLGPTLLVAVRRPAGPAGGILLAREPGQTGFGPEALELVESLADQAALAVAFDLSQQQLRRLAVLDDRERIAKDLHDGVIQSLFAVGMGLQAAAALTAERALAARLESAVDDLDAVIRDLRNYIFGLRPGALADRQLDQALRQLAAEFEARTGVTTVVDLDPTVAAELGSKAAELLQIVREALSNVGRHAEAATCRVALWRSEGSGVLEIDDDGRGFDVHAGAGTGHGLGLGNLRERAGALGATFDLSSAAGKGTTVRVMIPL